MPRELTNDRHTTFFLLLILVANCSSGNDTKTPLPPTSDAGVIQNDGQDDNAVDAALPGHQLTLSLDPSIDQPDDNVKAQSIDTAVMFDKDGSQTALSTILDGAAVFDLTNVMAGDYFIEINGDTDDLVPTRIDDPSQNIVQRVGQKLHASYIGPQDNPTYRINTYPDGQVVEFFTGNPIPGEQPYVFYTFAPSKLEIRLLGTAHLLNTFPLPKCPGHSYVPPDGWLLNTDNEDHHGDLFNANNDLCYSCHGDGWRRLPSYDYITPSSGWCFKCHEGPGGAGAGFVDPTK